MTEADQNTNDTPLAMIEPDDRIVVLARTIQAPGPELESTLSGRNAIVKNAEDSCLGSALYRHRTIFQNKSDAPVWSHLELSYFRSIVPASVVQERVVARQPVGINLLRAEILLTTPSSFILPRNWQGLGDHPVRFASLEYLDVHPRYLSEYRDAMRVYCGPAAAKLVKANRFGTFRAMETAAVLYQAPEFKIEWNQIHLCELDPNGFEGFGKEFQSAFRKDSPVDAKFSDSFADFDRLRTVPRWTFNDPVLESDAAVAQVGAE